MLELDHVKRDGFIVFEVESASGCRRLRLLKQNAHAEEDDEAYEGDHGDDDDKGDEPEWQTFAVDPDALSHYVDRILDGRRDNDNFVPCEVGELAERATEEKLNCYLPLHLDNFL